MRSRIARIAPLAGQKRAWGKLWLVLVENYIAAQSRQRIAQATGLTVPRTPNGVLGYAAFIPVLHPGHAVTVGIVEDHPRPSREYDHQVARQRLAVLVSVDDIEGLGERQKMRMWISIGDPAHAVQVVGAEDVAGNMPAKQMRLGLGNVCCNLFEVGIRVTPGDALVPAPCLAGARVEPIGLQCVASLAGTRDALRTTFPWRRRDIHHATKFAISFADAYQLIAFPVFFSVWSRRPGTRQIAFPWSCWWVVVGFGGQQNKRAAFAALWLPGLVVGDGSTSAMLCRPVCSVLTVSC
jgi:hypothetical protein